MKTLRRILRPIVFLVLSAGIALVLRLRIQAPAFTIRNHTFRPEIGPLLLAAVLIFVILIGLWALISQIWTKNSRLNYKEALALDFPTYVPIAFFLLAPLALNHYLTRDDLQERLGLLAVGVGLAVLYLKAVRVAQADREGKSNWGAVLDRFFAWPTGRRIAVLAVLALLLTNGGALLMTGKGVSFGGDEPHYLLISHSLVKDADLNLANNYKNKDFESYMPPGAPIRPHTVPGKKPGSQYSFHSPGISVFLLPFYALGLALGKSALIFLVRFAMSLIGAFFGIQIYLYARQAWGRERLALGLWTVVTLSTPVFFYANHIYPEIFVAAAGLYVFRRLRFDRARRLGDYVLIGLLTASFIWFHALKYAFIQAPLFLYAIRHIWKQAETAARWRRLAALIIPAGLCGAVYFAVQYVLYGSFNPTSVSWQGAMDGRQTLSFLKELFTGIPFRFRWETLAGYFLDQRDGLLLYAPVYVFAFLGCLSLVRKKTGEAGWLLFIALPYILVSAFLTQRAGYAPQARPLVAVIWVLAIFIGAFIADSRKHVFRYLFDGAVGLSFLMTWLLCQHPFALYQETTFGTTERAGSLFVTLSNLHVYLPNLLPSFIKIEEAGWTPNLIWIAALAIFVVLYAVGHIPDKRMSFGGHAAAALLLLAGFFAMVVCFPRAVLMSPRTVDLPTGERWTFYSLSRVAKMGEPARFDVFQDNRDYDFYFTSKKPLDKLEVEFGSPYGDYTLRLNIADAPIFAVTTHREVMSRTIESPPAYPWKGQSLYRVTIQLGRKSDVRTAVTPYVFALRPAR
ncbi:MAG: hypothetical protein NTW38_09790 [Candidatus Aminicenantes bacterium]|nr:hypothetical protein [Candidatus Aminicenantes bacterium]